MTQPFCFRFRVRYNECDAQQVVFNARYGDYVDIAMTEFMRALGRDYNQLLAQGLDNQVVKLTTEWQSSARFDDVMQIMKETDATNKAMQVAREQLRLAQEALHHIPVASHQNALFQLSQFIGV